MVFVCDLCHSLLVIPSIDVLLFWICWQVLRNRHHNPGTLIQCPWKLWMSLAGQVLYCVLWTNFSKATLPQNFDGIVPSATPVWKLCIVWRWLRHVLLPHRSLCSGQSSKTAVSCLFVCFFVVVLFLGNAVHVGSWQFWLLLFMRTTYQWLSRSLEHLSRQKGRQTYTIWSYLAPQGLVQFMISRPSPRFPLLGCGLVAVWCSLHFLSCLCFASGPFSFSKECRVPVRLFTADTMV